MHERGGDEVKPLSKEEIKAFEKKLWMLREKLEDEVVYTCCRIRRVKKILQEHGVEVEDKETDELCTKIRI